METAMNYLPNRHGHYPTIPWGPLLKQIELFFFSGILTVYFNCNYTWSYENRVSKHFVIFSLNSLFTVLFAYVFG